MVSLKIAGIIRTGYAALAFILAMQAPAAQADTFTYRCKFKNKSLPLKVDGSRHELTWRGKIFKTTELQAGEQNDCPRFGWRAKRSGQSFDFCTASGNFASFSENGSDVQCEQD